MMKDLFMCLLVNLRNHGKIKSAMFDSGFAKITLVDGDNQYDVSIIKNVKSEEEKDGN